MIDQLELWLRRGLLLVIAAPFLVWGGLGTGHIAARAVALEPGPSIRIVDAPYVPTERLERLGRYMTFLRDNGVSTEQYVRLYQDHVQPVEITLVGWGVDKTTARTTAWPLVEYSYQKGLDPATVTAIVLVESDGRPWARSNVGARGLMQVMPMHKGRWDGCGPDLHDIEANLCYGTSILAAMLQRYKGDENRAFLSYNGCIRGTNTPNCHIYPERVRQLRARIRDDWARAGARVTSTVAASP